MLRRFVDGDEDLGRGCFVRRAGLALPRLRLALRALGRMLAASGIRLWLRASRISFWLRASLIALPARGVGCGWGACGIWLGDALGFGLRARRAADKKGDDKGEERHCGEAKKIHAQHPSCREGRITGDEGCNTAPSITGYGGPFIQTQALHEQHRDRVVHLLGSVPYDAVQNKWFGLIPPAPAVPLE